MFCYHCGCHLTEQDYCTACGADVSLYKKIMAVSNVYYNDGLEKARVRDLSGAVVSLRQSLKYNRNNVEARNLLGLIYYEIGEAGAALGEWVISSNFRKEKNIANDYISQLQSDVSQLDADSQAIVKYNRALYHCRQDSTDMAVIQLRNVLSLNPRFVKAHLLLGLLYMASEQWERALKEVRRVLDIDHNNTIALHFRQEIDRQMTPEEAQRKEHKRKKREEAIRYQSDNEMIIQPVNVREPKNTGFSTLLNILIGLVIGMAVVYFLLVPAAQQRARDEMQPRVMELNEQIDVKNERIQELESNLESLSVNVRDLQQEIETYIGSGGTLEQVDSLLSAASTFLETEDLHRTAENLESIAARVNLNEASEAFRNLYYGLSAAIGPDLSQEYNEMGHESCRNGDYATGIEQLVQAVNYDASNEEALYNLGIAYEESGDIEQAIPTYEKFLELFPGTVNANRIRKNLDALKALQ